MSAAAPEPHEVREYLAENYGRCTAVACRCLRDGWRGRACLNWQPTGARTFDELGAIQRRAAFFPAPLRAAHGGGG